MRRYFPYRLVVIAVFGLTAMPTSANALDLSGSIYPLIPGLTVRVVSQSPRANRTDSCRAGSGDEAPPLDCRPGVSTTLLGYDAGGSQYNVTGDTYNVYVDGAVVGSGRIISRINTTGSSEAVAILSTEGLTDGGILVSRIYMGSLTFDVTNGRILVPVTATYSDGIPTAVSALIEISGFPKLFDTLLTFVPGGTLAALTPGFPDGFRSAGSMQVWTGDVRSMPDWSQAQPLACMAATSPAPGQVVTVDDTLHNPPVGHGRYYLSASVSGADRRLGRQYVIGAFSARDPGSLPVCLP